MSLYLAHSAEAQPVDLLAEASHRIANHLAMLAGLLRLQGSSLRKAGKPLTADEVWLVLDDCGRRLETVGKVHQLLAANPHGAPIRAADFLNTVVNAIVASPTANRNELAFEFPVTWLLCAEDAVALGLLVGELVTNAVKYSHPTGIAGAIKIQASAFQPGEILILISDDGVGLPEGLDPLESPSLGFRTVRALATQLGAKLFFQDRGLGLTCGLKIPMTRGR